MRALYPNFSGIFKDYDALNNKPTLNGKPLQGEIKKDLLDALPELEGSPYEHSHSYGSIKGKPSINGVTLDGEMKQSDFIIPDGLMFNKILTSKDDFDYIFEDGVYVYSTASPPANAPFPNAAVVEVFGANSKTTQKIQRGYRYGEAGYSAFRALYNNSWGVWSKTPYIKIATTTATTTAGGNALLVNDVTKNLVLAAYAMSEDGTTQYKCVPYVSAEYLGWFAHITEVSSDEAISSQKVKITYYYTKL